MQCIFVGAHCRVTEEGNVINRNMFLIMQVSADNSPSTHRNTAVRVSPSISTRIAILTILAVPSLNFAQNEVVLSPTKDTSLYEDSGGTIGNGAGQFLFVGKTRLGAIRRTVLAFDVAGSIPAGAAITEVELVLHMSQTASTTRKIVAHRLMADWGEGTSDAGGQEGAGTTATINDATWKHTFFDTGTWQTLGGDFDPKESAVTDVDATGSYSWSGDGITSDVQQWLDVPEQNFGWILIGDEGINKTAKRFDSRENPTQDNRPQLRIAFSTATSASDDELPSALKLRGNFPNPFRGTTSIIYELSSPRVVTLDVFDLQGRRVATLVNGLQSAGVQNLNFDATGLAPGSYLYRLTGEDFSHLSKMIVLP